MALANRFAKYIVQPEDQDGGQPAPAKKPNRFAKYKQAETAPPIEGEYSVKPAAPAQSNGGGIGPVNPMVAMGQAAQQQLPAGYARPEAINQANPIITAQRASQTQAGNAWAAQEEARKAEEARLRQELKEANALSAGGGGPALFRNANGDIRPGSPVDTDLSKGIVASPIHAERAGIGAAEATANLPLDIAKAAAVPVAAMFDPAFQGAMAGAEYGVGVDALPDRLSQAYEAGGYGDMQKKMDAGQRFDFSGAKIPVPEELQSVSGSISEGFMQYLFARGLVGKLMPGGKLPAQNAKDIGALGFGFSGDSGRTADMIDPETMGVMKDYVRWLQTNEADSPFMGRIKNMTEDATINLLLMGLGRGGKALANAAGDVPTVPTNAGGARPGPIDTAAVMQPPARQAPPPIQPAAQAPPSLTPPPVAQPPGRGAQAGATGAGQQGGPQPVLNAVPAAPPAVSKQQRLIDRDTIKITRRIMRSAGIKDADVMGYLSGAVQRFKSLNDARVPLAFFLKSDLPKHFPDDVANQVGTNLDVWGRARNAETGSRGTINKTTGELRKTQQDFLTQSAERNLFKGSLIGREDQIISSLRETGKKGYEPVLDYARQAVDGRRAPNPAEAEALSELSEVMSDPMMLGYVDDATRIRAKKEGVDIDQLIAQDPVGGAHWLQSEFRRLSDAAEDAVTGKPTRMSQAYDDLRDMILDPLKRAAPGYEGAMNRYGHEYGAKEAVRFGKGAFTTAKSTYETAQFVRRFKKLGRRQQTVAWMSIRDEFLNQFRGTPEEAAAKVTLMQQEGALDLLEQLGPRGKKFADDIRKIAQVENPNLRAIDQGSGSPTHSNTRGAANAVDMVQSPINRGVGALGDKTSWPVSLAGDAVLAASGLPPVLTASKVATGLVDRFGNPSKKVLNRATEGLYGLPKVEAPVPAGRTKRVGPPRKASEAIEEEDDIGALLKALDETETNPAQRGGTKGKALLAKIDAASKAPKPPATRKKSPPAPKDAGSASVTPLAALIGGSGGAMLAPDVNGDGVDAGERIAAAILGATGAGYGASRLAPKTRGAPLKSGPPKPPFSDLNAKIDSYNKTLDGLSGTAARLRQGVKGAANSNAAPARPKPNLKLVGRSAPAPSALKPPAMAEAGPKAARSAAMEARSADRLSTLMSRSSISFAEKGEVAMLMRARGISDAEIFEAVQSRSDAAVRFKGRASPEQVRAIVDGLVAKGQRAIAEDEGGLGVLAAELTDRGDDPVRLLAGPNGPSASEVRNAEARWRAHNAGKANYEPDDIKQAIESKLKPAPAGPRRPMGGTSLDVNGVLNRELRNRARIAPPASPTVKPLATEERRAWQAEKGPVDDAPLYHGTAVREMFDEFSGPTWLHKDRKYAQDFAWETGPDDPFKAHVIEAYARGRFKDVDEKSIERIGYDPEQIAALKREGYDGAKSPDGQVLVFDPKDIRRTDKPSPTVKPSGAPKPPPVKNGFGGSKLPMDEASRMQRAEADGFDVDTPLYHGTASYFDEFKPNDALGLAYGPGIYFATDPAIGSRYAARAQRFNRVRGRQAGEPRVVSAYARGPLADADALPKNMLNALVSAVQARDARAIDRIHAALKGQGFRGVQDKWRGEVMIFDPADIRSVNAAFDPSQSSSSKLLAGMADNATGYGTAGGAIAGGTFARDTDGDGVVSASERVAGALGGAITGGVGGAAFGAGARRMAKAQPVGNRLRNGGVDQATFGGSVGARNLATRGERRPQQALEMAEQMAARGANRDEIWDATSKQLEGTPYAGAFKGLDGQWRFEIDDSGAQVFNPARGDFVDFKRLKDRMTDADAGGAYPELSDMTADFRKSKRPSGAAQEEMTFRRDPENPRWMIAIQGPDAAAQRSLALHERQHIIQQNEGFATGASPDEFIPKDKQGKFAPFTQVGAYRKYRRTAGETEARNVEARQDLTPAERRARRPWETQDVPDDQQIVRFGGGKAESRPTLPTGNKLKPPPAQAGFGGGKGPPKAPKPPPYGKVRIAPGVEVLPPDRNAMKPNPRKAGKAYRIEGGQSAEELAARKELRDAKAANTRARSRFVMRDNREALWAEADAREARAMDNLNRVLEEQAMKRQKGAKMRDAYYGVKDFVNSERGAMKTMGALGAVTAGGIVGAMALSGGGEKKKGGEAIPETDPRYFVSKLKDNPELLSMLQDALVRVNMLKEESADGRWGGRTADGFAAHLAKNPERNPNLPLQESDAYRLMAQAYGGYQDADGKWYYDDGEPIKLTPQNTRGNLPDRPLNPSEARRMQFDERMRREKAKAQP